MDILKLFLFIHKANHIHKQKAPKNLKKFLIGAF